MEETNTNLAVSEKRMNKSLRGLASADPETRRLVAQKGGRAVSQNRMHMSEIGRRGGMSVSRDRMHMAEIGKRGGLRAHHLEIA